MAHYLEWRYNGTKMYQEHSTTKVTGADKVTTSHNLCYRRGDTTYYLPLVEASMSNGKTIMKNTSNFWRVDKTVKGTLHVKVGGSEYMVPQVFQNFYVMKGTYTPSVFENIISSYIALNSTGRNVSGSNKTVTVNNQTVTISTIKWIQKGTSPGDIRVINFNGTVPTDSKMAYCSGSNGFTAYSTYVTYRDPSFPSGISGWGELFKYYSNYSITVNTSFDFV